jgi:type I site-specific restriction-modification system R (restriction) subunit
VWRRLVDYGIQRPDFITGYILDRQAELQAQGDSLDGDIAHAHHELAQIAQERKAYHKQKARGKMTQQEYDELIDETEESRLYWESEIVELQELRDNMGKVRAGIDYVNKLLASIQTILPQADMPPKELKRLPEERRREILKIRQGIIRALVEKVTVWASGQVMIDGALDGSEAAQFELGSS